jgi:oxygen-dependent protoporphyrinogen oxidase
MLDTIVIGGGISGLVAAYRLMRAERRVLLLESQATVGGAIRTERVGGFLVERGPNSIRMTDEIEVLAADLGITDQIIAGDPRAARYIYHGGRLVPAPAGPGKFLRTPLLSARAKLRLLAEPLIGRPGRAGEQSIAEFTTRRLGREVHDVFVSAFVSGIYAGDTSKLSAEAVFPKLVELEREHGGLARGAIASLRKKREPQASRPKRRPITVSSLRGGLDGLPDALGAALGENLRTDTPAERVERRGDEFVVRVPGGEFAAQRVYVAAPAHEAARLVEELSPPLANLLREVDYSPLASVSLAYPREQVEHEADGFGFLAPRVSGLRTLGAIFTSSLFEDRAPDDWVSFTCFIGGATDPGALDLSDEALVAQVAADLGRTVLAHGEPRVLAITRWQRAIPQYTIGHRDRVSAIEAEARRSGLRLFGNYLHGVSVGDCVAAASKIGAQHDV